MFTARAPPLCIATSKQNENRALSGTSGSSGASCSAAFRASPAAGLGVEFEACGISALVYHQEKYAFTPMMYITRDKKAWKLRMRNDNLQHVITRSYSISELQEKRLLWCVQNPSSIPAFKARNVYKMVQNTALLDAQRKAQAGEASRADGAAPLRGRVSGLATLACAARVLVASRATSAGSRT